MARIIDAASLAAEMRSKVADQTAELRAGIGRPPGLAVLLVGDDREAAVCAQEKERAAVASGFHTEVHRMPRGPTAQAVTQMLAALSRSPELDGLAMQLPFPDELDMKEILAFIDPAKDVDGLTAAQVGHLLLGGEGLHSCTADAVMEILRLSGVPLQGRQAVVVGRGAPAERQLALLLLAAGATVGWTDARNDELAALTGRADVLVSLAGVPGCLGGEHIKRGAAVIDAGEAWASGGRRGDVRFEEAQEAAGWLTQAPAGIGPVTIAVLLRHTVEAMRWRFSASGTLPAS
jgi:methylenetetrahydrofolate dehydrogenase (NADP+)/methenyltetrahydrofolate cyclohydrolase